MSAHKTSVGPSGDRSDATDAGLPGSDDVRQAAPPNKPGVSTPGAGMGRAAGDYSHGTPDTGYRSSAGQACTAERGNTSAPTGPGGHEPGPPCTTLHDTAVLLENRLRNLAYLCAKGRSVTPGMIGPIVREYADDLKAALAS